MNEWIKTSERLPEYMKFILFCENTKLQTCHLGWRDDPKTLKPPIWQNWFSETGEWFRTKDISHWMPLLPLEAE